VIPCTELVKRNYSRFPQTIRNLFMIY